MARFKNPLSTVIAPIAAATFLFNVQAQANDGEGGIIFDLLALQENRLDLGVLQEIPHFSDIIKNSAIEANTRWEINDGGAPEKSSLVITFSELSCQHLPNFLATGEYQDFLNMPYFYGKEYIVDFARILSEDNEATYIYEGMRDGGTTQNLTIEAICALPPSSYE